MSKLKPSQIEKGYICPCGKYHPFHVWVFAHPTIRISHTCECGRVNIIQDLYYVETLEAKQ